LAERVTEVAQLGERIAGLTARLAEHEAHAQSLEQKHQHAREALEHYRTSVKDQREQEQRRHEHQVQELQVALRQANEALTAKNHELVQLNRDNGQWLERHSRLERELAQVRQAADDQRTAAEYQALLARWTQDAQALESARVKLANAHADLAKERERREQAEAEALRAGVRQDTLEQLLAQLRPDRADSSGTNKNPATK
jgi:chromosome segregation ATPase